MRQLLFICLLITPWLAIGQTATSVQNGNWTSPMTWSCSCVPTPGYTVVINHSVTLNTSFAYTSGSITVNSGGALLDDVTGRDLWINGGSFSNSGSVDVRFMLVQAGSFTNSGTITATAIANYVPFTNAGTFQSIDSMYNASDITNNGSFILIDSITNAGTFTNNGSCIYNQATNTGLYINNSALTFTDITNTGTFNNTDTITCLNSMWNTGVLTGTLNSYVDVANGFLNDDVTAHDAVFINDGRMNVHDSWYNFDTIKGSGSFIVQDTSLNFGWMKENFDFCDLTPPSSAPFVDINSGSISANITWCTNTDIAESPSVKFDVFPNPATSIVTINSNAVITSLELWSVDGRLMQQTKNKNTICVDGLAAGVYNLVITSHGSVVCRRIVVSQQ